MVRGAARPNPSLKVADPLRQPPLGRSRPCRLSSFRGQAASASTVALARTLGCTNPSPSMPASKSKAAASKPLSVADFLAELDHPHKPGIERLRALILTSDKRVTEELKWNAPSFKITDHFATFRVHPPKDIQLILHTGATATSNAKRFEIEDPSRLLKWPATDRAVLTLRSEADLQSHLAEVEDILKQWVAQL